mgnify:CR=1 FL=1
MASLTVKYGAWQVDGVEFASPQERTPAAEDVSFAFSGTTITAADLQAAVAFLALRRQFSYQTINAGVTIPIELEQQMTVHQECYLNETGELYIDGEVVVYV